MDAHHLLLLIIPAFVLLIWLENFLLKRKKVADAYQYEQSISNISVGIADRLCSILLTGIFYSVYTYLYTHYRWFSFVPTVWVWVLAFLLTDFLWYWYHRLGHTVNIFWSAHVVHHSSTDYNFTVAARITIFQQVIRLLFWSILPLIGFPPYMVFSFLLFLGIYQFFMHTRLYDGFGRMLNYFLVTPSFHRVHHASNEEYLDKNFGGVLIIWDRIFGTFAEEKTTVTYGLTKPLKSHSFLWIHFHHTIQIIYQVIHAHRLKEIIKILFGRPTDIQSEHKQKLEKIFISQNRGNIHNNKKLSIYLNVQLLFSLVLLAALPFLSENKVNLYTTSALILLTLINCGAILEKKSWIFVIEYIRYLFISLVISYNFPYVPVIFIVIHSIAISIFFYYPLKHLFIRFMYGEYSAGGK